MVLVTVARILCARHLFPLPHSQKPPEELRYGDKSAKPESQEQLTNIAEILKAFPAVKVKIGGYTDNVGDPAANMKLSQDRATNVVNDLIKKGVAADRMTAEGYGDQHPIADNNVPEGRAMNRRIALRVTAT